MTLLRTISLFFTNLYVTQSFAIALSVSKSEIRQNFSNRASTKFQSIYSIVYTLHSSTLFSSNTTTAIHNLLAICIVVLRFLVRQARTSNRFHWLGDPYPAKNVNIPAEANPLLVQYSPSCSTCQRCQILRLKTLALAGDQSAE